MSELNIKELEEEQILKNSIIRKPIVWIFMALVATFLWGSAFPTVKIGYSTFQIDVENVYSILLFAGVRFTLAGLITLIVSIFITKKPPLINSYGFRGVLFLGVVQTSIQYAFFYISLSNTSGINGSIISGSTGFISVALAAIYYKKDGITLGKVLGCIMGFIGVIILNLGKGNISLNFALNGELFMLMASLFSAFGGLISKELTTKMNSFVVTGYQLFIGGIFLILIGYIGGGIMIPKNIDSIYLLIYLSLISCVAFGLWTTLLKFHPLSKIGIFQTLVPIFGSILSVIFLGEDFKFSAIISLALIIGGIFVLNNWDKLLKAR